MGPLSAPAELDSAIRAIPGVLGTGLFLGLYPTVVIAQPNGSVTTRDTGLGMGTT